MSQAAWDALANAAAGQTVEVHISKLNAANEKVGPIYRTWTIANGKLHGTIYYNTYDSSLAGQTGAMMRIKGNSVMPEVLAQMNGQCTVCTASPRTGRPPRRHRAVPRVEFDLTGGQVNPPVIWTSPTESKTAFAALYPKNGEVFVVNGAPPFCEIQRVDGVWTSELRTKSGTLIDNSGIEGLYAQTPVFSHDGNHVAFYDRAPNGSWGNCPGTLAMMDYDAVTQKFSNYQVLATPPPGRHYGWPAFTPDSEWVIYQNGVGDNLQTTGGNTGKLIAVHTVTKEKVLLSSLNGDGYMPRGIRDEGKNYEPSTTPIASGGYFWVIFTSRRTYGNSLNWPGRIDQAPLGRCADPNRLRASTPATPVLHHGSGADLRQQPRLLGARSLQAGWSGLRERRRVLQRLLQPDRRSASVPLRTARRRVLRRVRDLHQHRRLLRKPRPRMHRRRLLDAAAGLKRYPLRGEPERREQRGSPVRTCTPRLEG